MPRKLLMTADTIGGVWTYALELTRGLAPHGWQVLLATMGAPLTPAQRQGAARLANLEVAESHFQLEWMTDPWTYVDRAGEWLLELERKFRPEVIHLNGYAHGALSFSAPVVVVAHSCVLSWWQAVKGEPAPTEWSEYRSRVQRGIHGASLLVAPTRAMLECVHGHYDATGKSSRVIANSRDPHCFHPAPKEKCIFAAGRLGDEAKNITTLAAAAAGLPWPVRVAGNRQDASGRAALPPNVEHLGFLPPNELAAVLSRAAIYAFPARYEPFGLSILEAALSGCALVLGDIPSLREIWGAAAIFVPSNDTAALRTALSELILDPVRRQVLGEAAYARALDFTPERQAHAYHSAYQALLHSP